MAPPCEGFFLCSRLGSNLASTSSLLVSGRSVDGKCQTQEHDDRKCQRDLFFSFFFFIFFVFFFLFFFYPLLGCRVVNPRVGDPGGAGLGALVSRVEHPGEQGWLPWYIYIYIYFNTLIHNNTVKTTRSEALRGSLAVRWIHTT